ncbi:hypothetical protein G6O67_000127 [Ophiocordyceps sinensis]|uniref:Adenine DNA glycosylase n=1 Tax=Ophiocordyceps sinensis TaxID=72228 RepID=A0A8H4PYG6_9HYPO|nr:hypothetical protein G6O67_000127 [Ophiocordyceps sinensis]
MVRRSARLSSATTTTGQGKKRPSRTTTEDERESVTDGNSASKRRRVASASRGSSKKPNLHLRLFSSSSSTSSHPPCLPPARLHSPDYHRPLLLSGPSAAEHRRSLLSWFDSVSAVRAMPWRKPWIDPADDDPLELRPALEVRAYEVWISEVMLQQTRVAVVVEYWNRWMARWPTIRDLARAHPDHVLAAWRGLGYYSRATRIHEAAKLVVHDPDMRGLLPSDPALLAARVPGIGRYTAGAISAIVFGRPEPMVDGNVLRVLSRQLGLYANVKTDKAVIDTVWAAADALVKAVARDEASKESLSDRPGRWGQALMELGSTVCTPKPDCSSCPITSTCRVYNEADALASGAARDPAVDMEDLCLVCMPFEEAMTPREAIADYARRFPAKVAKKAVRQEETVVCAIRHPDGSYLIQRRPPKGLLAGLWELPGAAVSKPGSTTAETRAQLARSHAATLVTGSGGLVHVGELGSVPWLFSHIKLTMHVHLLVADGRELAGDAQPRRWSRTVDAESMGTGMRKCWALVRHAEPGQPHRHDAS